MTVCPKVREKAENDSSGGTKMGQNGLQMLRSLRPLNTVGKTSHTETLLGGAGLDSPQRLVRN